MGLKFTAEHKCRKLLLEQCQIGFFDCVEATRRISTLHLHTARLWKCSGKGSSLCEEEREVQKKLNWCHYTTNPTKLCFQMENYSAFTNHSLTIPEEAQGRTQCPGFLIARLLRWLWQRKQSLGVQWDNGISEINWFHHRQQAVMTLMARDQEWRSQSLALPSPAAEVFLWLPFNPSEKPLYSYQPSKDGTSEALRFHSCTLWGCRD